MNARSYWYKNGKLHRDGDLPAIEYSNGLGNYYKNGELHRINGPAVIDPNRTISWYKKGKLHRTDGPTIKGFRPNGDYFEYHHINGLPHKLDGYAYINGNDKRKFVNGEEIND